VTVMQVLPIGALRRRSQLLTILAVGEDNGLLKTRAEVLRKTGANVLCSSGTAAFKYITEWEFDLIVLCHSVPQQDAERISEAAHRKGSKTLVLLLVSDRVHEQDYDGIGLDGRSFVEPDCLIRSASELLARQTRRRPVEMPQVRKAPSPSARKVTSPLARKKPSCPADIAARRVLSGSFENRRAS
jgi:PleD family two-component response regulator